jgi:hypothetical protein
MSRIIETRIDIDLPSFVSRMELVSPFVSTTVTTEDYPPIQFEVSTLDWLAELRKVFRSGLQPPFRYSTNLTAGGEEFTVELRANGSVALSVYDKRGRRTRSLELTHDGLRTLVSQLYTSVAKKFADQGSSEAPVIAECTRTLEALQFRGHNT